MYGMNLEIIKISTVYKEEKMKKRTVVSCIMFFCLLIGGSVGCSTLAKSEQHIKHEYWGVWTNERYNLKPNRAAKIIYFPDMTFAAYDCDFANMPRWRGTISIIDKWKDEEGNSWYKITTNQLKIDVIVYELWRISESGTVLEGVWNVGAIPTNINSSFETYTVYYRNTNTASTVTEKKSGKTRI